MTGVQIKTASLQGKTQRKPKGKIDAIDDDADRTGDGLFVCVCGPAKASVVSTKYKTKPSMSHRNGAHRAGESSVPLQCLTRPTDRSGTGL
jgi:hypothetical protein